LVSDDSGGNMDNLNELVEFAKKLPGAVALYRVKANKKATILYYSDEVPELYNMNRELMEKYIISESKEFFTHETPENVYMSMNAQKTGWSLSAVGENTTYRIIRMDGTVAWIRSESTIVEDDGEEKLIIALLSDVSKETECFENIVNKSDNMTVIYKESDYSVLYTSDRFDVYFGLDNHEATNVKVFELLGYDSLEDFKKYLLTYVTKNDAYHDKKKNKYFHINSSQIKWWEYNARTLTFNDVTQLVKEKEIFVRDNDNQFIAISSDKDTVISCHMDLTENRIIGYVNIDPRNEDSLKGGIASDVFSIIWEKMPVKEHKEKFEEKFTVKKCLESFEIGETYFRLDHGCNDITGYKRSYVTSMTLYRNPINQHVEGFLVQKDRTNEYYNNVLSKIIVEKDYITVGVIDYETKSIYPVIINGDYGIETSKDIAYETFLEKLGEKYINDERLAEYLSKLSIDTTEKILSVDCDYSFTTTHDKSKASNSMYKYSFQTLNKTHKSVIFTIEDMTKQLQYDSVISGLNMIGFENNATRMLDALADKGKYSILHFDIKNFKVMNLLYGHNDCDRLLKMVYEYLRTSALKPLITARIGDDNFACLVFQENINLYSFDEFLQPTDEQFLKFGTVQLKCGIYNLERDKDISVQGMCDRAKLAKQSLFENKGHYYAVFDKKVDEEYQNKNRMFKQLGKAFENDEFQVYYQPIVDAEDENIIAIEALARWVQSDGTCLRPGQFLSTLEEMGQLGDLDKVISTKAIEGMMRRVNAEKEVVPVSFNLSRMDFKDSNVLDIIFSNLSQKKNVNENIFIEITESIYYELTDNARNILLKMKEMGAKMIIDDFGSGQSSFNMLMDFQFDYLKLDVDFVRMIGHGYKSNSIVIALIDMAHRMKLKVIAEGVETREQANFLRNYGCDYFQGYLFYKPMDAKSLSMIFDEK